MNSNMKAGIVSLIFGLTYTLGALNLTKSTVGNPLGPIIYPMLLGIMMSILGAISLYNGLRKQKIEGKVINEKFVLTQPIKMIIFSCVASVVYALIFDLLGYVIATTIFMLMLLFAINGKVKWKTNILVAVIFSISIYLLFSKVFYITLPTLPYFDI